MSSHFNPNTRITKRNSVTDGLWIRVFVVAVLIVIWVACSAKILKTMSAARSVVADVVHQTVSLAAPKSLLVARQEALRVENESLRQQLAGMQLMEDENNSLRELMNYPKLTRETITARVISKPSQSIYDRIVIDRGANDGVTVGDKVIAGENSYIATIDSVTDTTAQGTMISGSFYQGDAIIARLGITVPVFGKGSGNFELHIPRDLEVRDGDVMAVPGFSDFVFGVIKTVRFDERDPYQTVLARTPVNLQELKFVRVIK